MHLQTICVRNFRRLKNVRIDLDKETTIFVGSNNSGKTSATYILEKFLGPNSKGFSIHDFNSDCWKEINKQAETAEGATPNFPTISLDLWFEVHASDLHRIIDLLPSLDWKGVPVGVRIEYSAKSPDMLLAQYREAHGKAKEKAKEEYHPWPKNLIEYLTKNLKQEYETKYYVLDWEQFDKNLNPNPEYQPLQLGNDTDRSGAKIIKSLIRIDLLNAQRYLDDQNSGGRAEDLSKRLNRFYDRNLDKKAEDFDAMQALSNSENELTKHLKTVFNSTINSINNLGYPGLNNPQLEIRANLNHENIVGQTKLHYSLGSTDELLSLPDRYNGLGFKNLIYMVIEILDFHARWIEDEKSRPPLHLIIIEEPEAHLHAQIQQVFIRKVWQLIKPPDSEIDSFYSQMIITTHSPHIIYESGFQPIRYFQRCTTERGKHTTNVLNLTTFYNESNKESCEFLHRYMKLTHCDLFFADAAILVEGNVERLLLPLMINKSFPDLNSSYLSIIEVGGAFGHLFKPLIEFIGLTTLIITDLDSVKPSKEVTKNEILNKSERYEFEINDDTIKVIDADENEEEIINEEGDDILSNPGKACMTDFEGAMTSNQILKKWLPRLSHVKSLLDASAESKEQKKGDDCLAHVRIAYQTLIKVEWYGEQGEFAGRTLEEYFALENLNWTQDIEQRSLGLRVVTKVNHHTLKEIRKKLFERVNQSNFNKTNFALGLMYKNPDDWIVPSYIRDGLKWLHDKVSIAYTNKEHRVDQISAEEEVQVNVEPKK